MRAALKRRLRAIVLLVAVTGALGLAAWLGPKLRTRPAHPPADGDVSLLVLVHLPTENRHQLVRFPFKNGEPQPAETVWEGSWDFFGVAWKHQVVGNRFVVTATGGVIDVWEKQALHEGSGELIEATDDRVVSGRERGSSQPRDRIVSFDLRTRKVERLAGREAEPYALPGIRSPDGTKSVQTIFSELILHRVGHPPQSLGEFWVHQSTKSSNYGNPPVLWLDADRFLTQHGNGNLIAVALDGTRTPVVDVPAKLKVIGAPHLSRNPDGGIVYWCGQDAFVIDLEAKTGELCKWGSLGHGFEASWESDWRNRYAIRYRGEEVGRVRRSPNAPGQAASTEGFVALVEERNLDHFSIQVWSSVTAKWTALDVRPTLIVGWMK